MLTSLHIKNFRGFKALDLVSLQRVNLIVGQNNTGKTGLLEALALLLWEPPSQRVNLPNLFRSVGGDSNENFWKWIFYNKDTKNPVELRAKFTQFPEFGLILGPNSSRTDYRHVGQLGFINLFTTNR